LPSGSWLWLKVGVLIDFIDFFFLSFIPIVTPATSRDLIAVSSCSITGLHIVVEVVVVGVVVLVLLPVLLVGFPVGFIEAEGV
jgi:hypothetical protein